MYDFIISILDLKEEDISLISSVSNQDHSVFITLKSHPQICPHCGSLSSRIHAYTKRKVNLKVLVHSQLSVFYNARRYKCLSCDRTFIEHNPFSAPKHHISTINLFGILKDLKPYTATYANVAKKYGVSPSTVMNIFDKHVQIDRKRLSSVICLDEFYFNRHAKYKYAFMILDFHTKNILDILESRHSSFLRDYFFHIPISERDRVKFICVDMYQPYLDIARIYFKNATICIDSFHVVKMINDRLDQVRKRILKRFPYDKYPKEYKLLKFNRQILLSSYDHLNNDHFFPSSTLGYMTTQTGLLEAILCLHPELKLAYELKEMYLEFNQINKEDAQRHYLQGELHKIIQAMLSSKLNEFIGMTKTLRRFENEILNSFVWFGNRRISNGPIEGKNNYIKKILSNANGMSNFQRARNRILYSQNYHETFSASEKQATIKRPGKKRGPYKKHHK